MKLETQDKWGLQTISTQARNPRQWCFKWLFPIWFGYDKSVPLVSWFYQLNGPRWNPFRMQKSVWCGIPSHLKREITCWNIYNWAEEYYNYKILLFRGPKGILKVMKKTCYLKTSPFWTRPPNTINIFDTNYSTRIPGWHSNKIQSKRMQRAYMCFKVGRLSAITIFT